MEDKKVIKFENGSWMDYEMYEHLKKWENMRNELMAISYFGQRKISDQEEDELYIKHGLTPPDRKPVRLGHFFMAKVDNGENSKMLWQEPDGLVYDFTGYPDRENINDTPFTEKWEYWRAVSSFDF